MSQDRTGRGAPPESQAGRRQAHIQTFSSLRNRDYRFLFFGNVFSFMAYWLQLLSLSWLVWELTKDPVTGLGSPLLSSTAAGVRAVPTLILGPWAGVLLDRVDRRRVLIATQIGLTVAALFFAALVATGAVEVWHAFVYASISAVFNAVMQPARQALIANTVPRADLQNAMALQAMAVNINRLIGALVGGVLITTVGIKWNFFVECFAYLAMGLLLIPMKTPYREESTALAQSVMDNLKSGLVYIWRDNRAIMYLTIMFLLVNLVFLPLPAILPAYTGEVFHRGADVGAYLLAGAGAGGLIATLLIASFGFYTNKGRVSLIALVGSSAAILVLAQSHWILLSIGMMFLQALFQTSFMVSNLTLVQTMIPDNLRGRVTSIYTLVMGLSALGIFLIGLFIELLGASRALTMVAAVSLAVAVYFLVFYKQVRQLP